MVPTLKTKGFRCYAEEAVLSGGQNAHAHLLSLVGTREAVKAVWARLTKGEAAYLLTERLPSGAFHDLLLSRALLAGELVVCEREDDLPGRFYRLLSAQLRLPLHPAWANWLWERAVAREVATRLEAQRLHAFEIELPKHDLARALRQALLAGKLPAVGETSRAA